MWVNVSFIFEVMNELEGVIAMIITAMIAIVIVMLLLFDCVIDWLID